MTSKKVYKGFTLSEVLITLGIIGVVAILTIPSLLNKANDSEYKTAYRKAFTLLSQAFLQAQMDGEIVELTGDFSSQGAEANFAAMQSRFKVIKSCADSYTEKCWNHVGEKWRGDSTSAPGFVDASGMAWKLRFPDSSNLGHVILVDTNGLNKPNVYGKDRFPLFMNNSNGKTAWLNISSGTVGMPTRISSSEDVLQNTTNLDEQSKCPSYPVLSCYYKTWLIGD